MLIVSRVDYDDGLAAVFPALSCRDDNASYKIAAAIHICLADLPQLSCLN